MGKTYAELDERLTQFILQQQLFFVATAPGDLGHVNISPKGYRDTFAVLSHEGERLLAAGVGATLLEEEMRHPCSAHLVP